MNSKSGTLYIVATPIGNLEDISLRALRILSEVFMCAAEDTRKTKILFNHHQIKTKLTSYHRFSERKKLNYLISLLKEGSDLALVSDAGTPLISDPGLLLVKEAISLGIKISPLPGPSSVTAALSVSGFNSDNFIFVGFPPRKKNERLSFIKNLVKEQRTLILFESGIRIKKLLEDISENSPQKNIFIAREISKMYETFYRGEIKEIINELSKSKFGSKGEFVLVFEEISKKNNFDTELSEEGVRILNLLVDHLPNNDAMVLASKILNIKKNILYKELIK
ncbi:MAG: 16S rRNA (cytidine(1402)-2'-O)-methyltransferase, partial [SAR86 cluster bacterium]|nr:16S rRNA (cytidine(1402)-2'-O)-methyltransferase [SAR86 cluster bacterium]